MIEKGERLYLHKVIWIVAILWEERQIRIIVHIKTENGEMVHSAGFQNCHLFWFPAILVQTPRNQTKRMLNSSGAGTALCEALRCETAVAICCPRDVSLPWNWSPSAAIWEEPENRLSPAALWTISVSQPKLLSDSGEGKQSGTTRGSGAERRRLPAQHFHHASPWQVSLIRHSLLVYVRRCLYFNPVQVSKGICTPTRRKFKDSWKPHTPLSS